MGGAMLAPQTPPFVGREALPPHTQVDPTPSAPHYLRSP